MHWSSNLIQNYQNRKIFRKYISWINSCSLWPCALINPAPVHYGPAGSTRRDYPPGATTPGARHKHATAPCWWVSFPLVFQIKKEPIITLHPRASKEESRINFLAVNHKRQQEVTAMTDRWAAQRRRSWIMTRSQDAELRNVKVALKSMRNWTASKQN